MAIADTDVSAPPAALSLAYLIGNAAVYMPGDTFGPRTLGDCELVWITAGSARYTHDGHEHDAPAGTVIFARPGFHEHYVWDARHTSRHLFLHFAIEEVPADWPSLDQWPVATRLPPGDAVRPLFRQVMDRWCRLHNSRGMRPPAAVGRMVAALLDALQLTAQDTPEGSLGDLPPAVVRATEWISAQLQRRPDCRMSLDDIALAAKANPGHLGRLFRAALGQSPMQVVQLMRMEQAMTLLERSNLTMSEIARRCGFVSQFHFSRVFRRTYGQPPTDTRDALRQGQPRPSSGLLLDAPPIDAPM